MAKRAKRTSRPPPNPYPDSTPRQSACMILWLALVDNPPYEWALKPPESIGLSESFEVTPLGGSTHARVEHMASAQGWAPKKRLEIVKGTTVGQILDCYQF